MKTINKAFQPRENFLNKKRTNTVSISKLLAAVLLLISLSSAYANNITVSNVSLTGQNTTSDFILVEFDVSWDNSWKVNSGPSNWDAAWIFVKYRLKTQNTWHHAKLNYTSGNLYQWQR